MNQILDINLLQLVQQLIFVQEHVKNMLMYDELSTKIEYFSFSFKIKFFFKQTCKSSANFRCTSLIRFQFLFVSVNATAGNVCAP